MSKGRSRTSLAKIVKRLNRFSNAADVKSSLDEAKTERYLLQLQSMRLTADQLHSTGLPAIVNGMRKRLRSDSALGAARCLIKDWRLAVEQAADDLEKTDGKESGEEGVGDGQPPKAKKPRKAAVAPSVSLQTPGKAVRQTGSNGWKLAVDSHSTCSSSVGHSNKIGSLPAAGSSGGPVRHLDEDSADRSADTAAATSDPVRNKCREMLQQTLELSPSPFSDTTPAKSPRRLAVEIESAVFADLGGGGSGQQLAQAAASNTRYKTRIRSLVMNLRDPRNPDLRDCLLRGGLSGAEVARMSPEQLASNEMKQLRERLAKEAIRLHQAVPAQAEAGSSLFTCKRCRKKNCTYNQLQTLPGDEPMTTYVLCNECGFRWKFN